MAASQCLSIDDHNDVYISCESIRANWFKLAIHLKVDIATIDVIKMSNEDPGRKLSDALSAWLRGTSPNQPRPSWSTLCEALSQLDRYMSERIAMDHPSCAGTDRNTPVALAVRQGDAETAAVELKKEFDYLSGVIVKEINQTDVHKLRFEITKYFKQEEGKISRAIEEHLSHIEHYSSSNAVWNYFFRHDFIGYINYSLVKVFQEVVKSPLLTKPIEEYEKDYKCFLELSLKDVHTVFQRCPDLSIEYPAGIPKFKIHLQNDKSMLELREFLEQCRLNPGDIDQLIIARIEQNCIIVTFAVLPHIAQRVVECLTAKDVARILKSNGVSVVISPELLDYQTTDEPVTDDDVTLSEDTLEPEFFKANQPSSEEILSIKEDKATVDTCFSDITEATTEDDASAPEPADRAVLTIMMQHERITTLEREVQLEREMRTKIVIESSQAKDIQKVHNKIKPYNLEVLKTISNDKVDNPDETDTKPSPDPNVTKDDWRYEPYLDHKREVMIISSFGDQTFSDAVVVDKPQDNSTSDKSRLELARQELDTLQDLYWKSETSSLAYVYTDFPGTQFSKEYYMDRMKQFMLKCREGAVLYYSGHGEKDTGNWCFKNGVITFDDVFDLYTDTMRGKPLRIVSDCSFAGKWVENAAVKLDELGIPSCGHHTREQEILLKVFASCRKNQKAAMSSYTKKQASINENDDKYVYYPVGPIDSDQDGVLGDFIKIRCNKKHTEQCQVIQPKSRWVDRVYNGVFLYLVRGNNRGKPVWLYVLVDEEKESAFNEKVATGNINVTDYGEKIESGWGKDPPQSVKDIFDRRFDPYLPQDD